MSRLLLVEDDMSLVEGLEYSLEKAGYELDLAGTMAEAKVLLHRQSYELALLDVGLPDGTGFELCRWLREDGIKTPVIFLTALDEEYNVIRGLDCGGDDYITKPFRLGELCARIRALLRRRGEEPDAGLLVSPPLGIDLKASRVSLRGETLELTGAEYRLLCLLVANAGRIMTRSAILDALWDGRGSYVDDNTLSVYIRRLREKIELDPSKPAHLLTVRGFGYQWRGEE